MKKIILISLLLSLLYPLFYLLFELWTPPGFVFSGMVGGDDGTNLAVMASVNHNLQNPWALTEPKNVFLNPNMGSPFLFVPLGYLAKFLGNQFLLIFQLTRFLGAFIFLLSVYIFLKEFFGERRAWRIFLLFCFSFGLGGLLFLRLESLVPDLPYVGMWRPITYEMFEGAGLIPLTILGRHYYTIPLALGLLSIVFLKRRRVVNGGFLLALTFIFYPALGVAFYGISVLCLLTGGWQGWRPFFLYYVVSVVGVLPWVIIYLVDSTSFAVYASLVKTVNPLGLLVSMVPNLLFVPFAFWQPSQSKENLFFSPWFLTSLLFSLSRTSLSARFMLVLWLPLVVLSYLGMENVAAVVKGKISAEFLVALLIVLTFPSSLFFSTRFLRKPLEPTKWELFPDYLPQEMV